MRIFVLDKNLDLNVQIDIAKMLGFDMALSEFKDDLTAIYALSSEATKALSNLLFFKKLDQSIIPDTWIRVGSAECTLEYLIDNNQVTEIYRQT